MNEKNLGATKRENVVDDEVHLQKSRSEDAEWRHHDCNKAEEKSEKKAE